MQDVEIFVESTKCKKDVKIVVRCDKKQFDKSNWIDLKYTKMIAFSLQNPTTY